MKLLQILSICILAAGLCHCSTSNIFSSKTSHADDDGRRPSEQGEGLEGYLIDPALVAVEQTDTEIVATGQMGAIHHVEDAPIEGTVVCLVETGNDTKVRASGTPTEDGSFLLTVAISEVDKTSIIYIGVDGACIDFSPAQNTAAYFVPTASGYVPKGEEEGSGDAGGADQDGNGDTETGGDEDGEGDGGTDTYNDDSEKLRVCDSKEDDCNVEITFSLTIGESPFEGEALIYLNDPADCRPTIEKKRQETCEDDEFLNVDYSCNETTDTHDLEECMTAGQLTEVLAQVCRNICRKASIGEVSYPSQFVSYVKPGKYLIQAVTSEEDLAQGEFELQEDRIVTLGLE